MKLLGVDFGHVFCGAGARNFDGSGYRAHRLWGPLAPDWVGSTFISKSVTAEFRAGNMPLDGVEPKATWPDCIRVRWCRGAVLNAVGLSNHGIAWHLDHDGWPSRDEPFLVSCACVAPGRVGQLVEAQAMAGALAAARPRFAAPFGCEINVSCGNTFSNLHGDIVGEARTLLMIFRSRLPDVPLVVKVNALLDPAAAPDISAHPACAAIDVSNAIPWGRRPDWCADPIDWAGLFGRESPLARYGGGSLSGAPLLPLVRAWVLAARRAGCRVPIVAGGGVLSRTDALGLLEAGASAIALGSVAILRPWRVRGIIEFVNTYFNNMATIRIPGDRDAAAVAW